MALNQDQQIRLARTSKDPEELMQLTFSAYADVLVEVARNEESTPEILKAITTRETIPSTQAVATNPACPELLLYRLAKEGYVQSVASNPMLPLLRDVGSDNSLLIDKVLASHSLDPDVLVSMSTHANDEVRKAILTSPFPRDIPVEALISLARDPDPNIQATLAARNCNPPEVILELLRSDQSQVNIAIVLGQTTPEAILDHIWEMGKPESFAVLGNPNVSQKLIDLVLEQRIYRAWYWLAGNTNLTKETSEHIFSRLLGYEKATPESEHHHIYLRILRNSATSPYVIRDIFSLTENKYLIKGMSLYDCMNAIACNPSTPGYVLEGVLRDSWKSGVGEAAIFSNPSLPVSMMEMAISEHGKDKYRKLSVAKNPGAPESILLKMLENPRNDNTRIAAHMLMNPNSTPDVLRRIYDKHKSFAVAIHTMCPPDVLEELSKTGSPQQKTSVASNLSTPTMVLRKMASSRTDEIRSAVALNPTTPEDVLRILARDRAFSVRLSVMRNRMRPKDVGWL